MRQDAFFTLTDRLGDGLHGDEILFCGLDGEDSDFVRVNRNRVRQAGSLHRRSLALRLIAGDRQVAGRCDLAGSLESDLALARDLLDRLRDRLSHVPEDPFLNYSYTPTAGDKTLGGDLPDPQQAVSELIAGAGEMDLVGIWASGAILSGLASSVGHRHWHRSTSFNLDWSCYLETDKAVKSGYSDFSWDAARLAEKLDAVRRGLDLMARPARTIQPGRYRAYLAPEAVQELTDLLAWGGFGLKSHRTAQTPLLRLAEGERALDSRVCIREEHGRGLAPGFTAEGFDKPQQVDLILNGQYRDCLANARNGKEYGAAVNSGFDHPESIALDAGEIPQSEVLYRLGTGLYIGNLWYLNYSDRNDCRITGMTRFGTFWVENGEPVAPVQVMRFDDSIYHLLGDRLEGLTRERELLLSSETYGGRSTASSLLPGILVSGIDLAL
ncbi:MAG: peptidase [Chromatiaceae bacterium]|jgi:predicted Zn-dependent protease|nr:peptidase [Chromatiaceae bacterium]